MVRTVHWYAEHEPYSRPLKSGEYGEFHRRNLQAAIACAE